MLKTLQARLQQYMNQELPDVQAGFRKEESKIIANICSNIEKATEFQKNIYFCFIDYSKAFDCVDHNELWKILKEIGIPDHLTCLQVKKQQLELDMEQQDWFKIGKGVCQGCILSPCLFNLHSEYLMRNAGLDKTHARIKIVGKISITSDMQMIPLLWQKVKRN